MTSRKIKLSRIIQNFALSSFPLYLDPPDTAYAKLECADTNMVTKNEQIENQFESNFKTTLYTR